MSSMDTGNQLRSQEFVQRSEMQSQSLRQDSANQMVGGVQQTLEAARQFAMLKAEADARLQMHEQEMQINAVKLQHMQALDATDLMGHQVEQARLQNKAMALSIEEQERRAESWKKSGMDEVQAEITRMYGGGHGLLEQGLEWREGSLQEIPAERLKMLRARAAAARDIPSYTDIRREFEAIQYDDPERAAELQAMLDDMKAKAGMGIGTPRQPKPPPVPLDDKTQAELVPAQRAIAPVIQDPTKQKAVASLLWEDRAAVAALMNANRNKENMQAEFTEREAFDYTVRILSDRNHPMFTAVRNYVQALWSKRFADPRQATPLFDR